MAQFFFLSFSLSFTVRSFPLALFLSLATGHSLAEREKERTEKKKMKQESSKEKKKREREHFWCGNSDAVLSARGNYADFCLTTFFSLLESLTSQVN